MGEVYRARDTKLGRDVADRVCRRRSAGRAVRRQPVLASLNHPHIGAIYGFEDAGGVHALVLERRGRDACRPAIATSRDSGLGIPGFARGCAADGVALMRRMNAEMFSLLRSPAKERRSRSCRRGSTIATGSSRPTASGSRTSRPTPAEAKSTCGRFRGPVIGSRCRWPAGRSRGGGRRGLELFYVAADQRLTSVVVTSDGAGRSARLGPSVALFRTPFDPSNGQLRQQYVVSGDNQRFLMNSPVGPPAPPSIVVMLNWKGR